MREGERGGEEREERQGGERGEGGGGAERRLRGREEGWGRVVLLMLSSFA